MIHNIVEENVNWALPKGIRHLIACGVKEQSRNGEVLVAPMPVCTTYTKPWQRVLFSPVRDANPFFHFMESLWMLAGRRDVAFIDNFVSTMKNYSDDGTDFHGAYGYRWRHWFAHDQLTWAVNELKQNSQSRRIVISMWDGRVDPQIAVSGGKDVPCNTHLYLSIRGGRLNMLVSCRSNDVIWGAYGANVVHFSILMEYLASCIGVSMGLYHHLSYNYHVYLDKYPLEELRKMAADAEMHNDYSSVFPYELFHSIKEPEFSAELKEFLEHPLAERMYKSAMLNQVAQPICAAYWLRKEDPEAARLMALKIKADDWRKACVAWLNRRTK